MPSPPALPPSNASNASPIPAIAPITAPTKSWNASRKWHGSMACEPGSPKPGPPLDPELNPLPPQLSNPNNPNPLPRKWVRYIKIRQPHPTQLPNRPPPRMPSPAPPQTPWKPVRQTQIETQSRRKPREDSSNRISKSYPPSNQFAVDPIAGPNCRPQLPAPIASVRPCYPRN
jgi:hypothetical protein